MNQTAEKFIPVYKRIFAHYHERILDGRLKAGTRIESIAEVQGKFNVGRETAKQALKLLAEASLIVQYRGKGSFVADIGPREKIWGLVFPFFSIQYDDLIQTIALQAKALGRDLRPRCDYNDWREEVRLVGEMLRDRYEAVLVIPTLDESKTWEYYSSLSPRNERLILLDHTMTSNDFRWVIQSYDLGVMLAFNYLIERKGGGVAFIESETWSGRNMVMDLMRWTYEELVRTCEVEFEPFIMKGVGEIKLEQIQQRGITGIICCDDAIAIQAIGRLKEQGANIPDEFGVVSYGNTDLGRFFSPPITTIDPKHSEIARVVTSLLLPESQSDKEGEAHLQHVVLPELIVRET